jgi:hypothetical protein
VHARPAAPERPEKRGGGERTAGKQTPAALVATITAKDLFDPTRRAPAAAPVTPDQVVEAGPPDNLKITGVRILGADREAFVIDTTQNNQQRRLRVGDQISGYTVRTIEPTRVMLASPSGGSVEMLLEVEAGPAAAARQTAARPRRGVVPGTPAPGVAPGAAGPTAAGVQPAPPVPPRSQFERPRRHSRVPEEVRQKLEQLRERDPRVPARLQEQGGAVEQDPSAMQGDPTPRLGGRR